ncbi:MAG: dTDP-4-dehydrorhamnose 3,5-epimerase family protein [Planctomycetales bacterium]|nr:dTDP-4-dehydrorhamnose 3,5-epimerase family protein [Planctomycetales bacterium]
MKSSASQTVYHEGPIEGVVTRPLERYDDSRGWLVELYRDDELPREHIPRMSYLCETLPGHARGPHEHYQQSDLFAFVGPGDLDLYLWDAREGSATYGNRQKLTVGSSNRQFVIVPPGVVHAFKNSGESPAWAFNAPNVLYAGEGKQGEVDEIRHEDDPDCPFVMD